MSGSAWLDIAMQNSFGCQKNSLLEAGTNRVGNYIGVSM